MGFCFNYSLHLFPLFLIALRQPYRSPQLILDPLSTPYNFFVHFSPVPNIPPTSPWSPILPWPHTTNLSTDFTPPRPKSSPRTSILPPAPALLIFPLPPPLPHRLSLPRLLGIVFKTVDSVAYSNPTNTETTSAHKISLSFSISVLHDKASMGLLKQHFR